MEDDVAGIMQQSLPSASRSSSATGLRARCSRSAPKSSGSGASGPGPRAPLMAAATEAAGG